MIEFVIGADGTFTVSHPALNGTSVAIPFYTGSCPSGQTCVPIYLSGFNPGGNTATVTGTPGTAGCVVVVRSGKPHEVSIQ